MLTVTKAFLVGIDCWSVMDPRAVSTVASMAIAYYGNMSETCCTKVSCIDAKGDELSKDCPIGVFSRRLACSIHVGGSFFYMFRN